MNFIKSTIFIAFISLVLCACKSTKEMTIDPSILQSQDKINAVTSSYNNWKTFSAKGKITLKGSEKVSSSMQIKMIKDKLISVSIRPIIGIEVFNLHITNDSIIIVDKLNDYYVTEGLQDFAMGFPIDISSMQDLFLNRAFILGIGSLNNQNINQTTISNSLNGYWSITPKQKVADFKYFFTFSPQNQLMRLTAKNVLNGESYAVSYSDFEQYPWGYFAKEFEINTKIGRYPFFLKIAYNSKIKWDEEVNVKVNKKDKYKQVTLREYLNRF